MCPLTRTARRVIESNEKVSSSKVAADVLGVTRLNLFGMGLTLVGLQVNCSIILSPKGILIGGKIVIFDAMYDKVSGRRASVTDDMSVGAQAQRPIGKRRGFYVQHNEIFDLAELDAACRALLGAL